MAKQIDDNVVEMTQWIEELECMIEQLMTSKNVKPEKSGRKEEVLALLLGGQQYSIQELAEMIGISDRNISSQLSYLRKDGYEIWTSPSGKKFLKS